MNTDAGQIYRTAEEIYAARKRGEPLVEVTEIASADAIDEYYRRMKETRKALSFGKRPKLRVSR